MALAVWIGVCLLILLGLAGSVLPGLPGAPLILLAAVIHKLLLPQYLSWWTVGALAVLAVVSILVETLFAVAGARWFKATFWGILGAGFGALLGLIGGVVGVLAGAVLGAMAAERFLARRSPEDAIKAGVGAGLGLLLSGLGKFVISLAMTALFAFACWSDKL
jgi:uncharacterized protein